MEVCSLAGLKPELLFADRIEPIVQCDLENLRKVEISGENIRFISERTGLHTSARSASSCILNRFSRI